ATPAGAPPPARVDASLNIVHPNGRGLLEQLAGEELTAFTTDETGRDGVPGRLSVRLSGTSGAAMPAFMSLQSDELTAAFSGEVTFLDDNGVSGTGDIKLQAVDATVASKVLGLPRLALAGDAPVTVNARLSADPKSAEVSLATVRLGDRQMEVAGTVGFDDAFYSIDATVNSAALSLDEITGMILQTSSDAPRRETAVEPGASGAGTPGADATDASTQVVDQARALLGLGGDDAGAAAGSDGAASDAALVGPPAIAGAWYSNKAFAFSRLENLRGRLRFDVAALGLGQGLDARLASGSLLFSPEGLTLQSFDATTLGGALTVAGSLKRQPAGAEFAVVAALDGADLENFGTADVLVSGVDATQSGDTGAQTGAAPDAGRSARSNRFATIQPSDVIPLPISRAQARRQAEQRRAVVASAPDQPRPDRLHGALKLSLNLNGRGLSPLGVMSVASGEGTLELGPATVPGIDPSVISPFASDWIDQRGEVGADALSAFRAGLAAAMARGYAQLKAPVRVALKITDGRLQADQQTLTVSSLPPGQAESQTNSSGAGDKGAARKAVADAQIDVDADLTRMAGSVTWVLEPTPLQPRGTNSSSGSSNGDQPAATPGTTSENGQTGAAVQTIRLRRPERRLPAVTVTLAGALNTEQLRYAVETAALERELIVQRMESNVARLEELRRAAEAATAARQAAAERAAEALRARTDQDGREDGADGGGLPADSLDDAPDATPDDDETRDAAQRDAAVVPDDGAEGRPENVSVAVVNSDDEALSGETRANAPDQMAPRDTAQATASASDAPPSPNTASTGSASAADTGSGTAQSEQRFALGWDTTSAVQNAPARGPQTANRAPRISAPVDVRSSQALTRAFAAPQGTPAGITIVPVEPLEVGAAPSAQANTAFGNRPEGGLTPGVPGDAQSDVQGRDRDRGLPGGIRVRALPDLEAGGATTVTRESTVYAATDFRTDLARDTALGAQESGLAGDVFGPPLLPAIPLPPRNVDKGPDINPAELAAQSRARRRRLFDNVFAPR
ncbi:MAG: hypothetical protein AAGF32_01290, partial [Pseudomonadota bacterium]